MEEELRQTSLWNSQTQGGPLAEFRIKTAETQPSKLEAFGGSVHPTLEQVEKLRLILSTYQDGTGMLMKDGRNLPGWRDFERAVAATFDGQAQESKHVFDVIVPPQNDESRFGISCKMRGELSKSIDRVNRAGQFQKGRVSMEMSNAAKYFWDTIRKSGVDESNFRDNPREAGIALINLVKGWHNAASREGINLSKSYYFVLEWDGKGHNYQLFQYSLELPDPETLTWYFPVNIGKDGKEKQAMHLSADGSLGTIFEWYSGSGGQLKYYPLTEDALWSSSQFQLEPLPNLKDLEYGIVSKARTYFPIKWSKVSK